MKLIKILFTLTIIAVLGYSCTDDELTIQPKNILNLTVLEGDGQVTLNWDAPESQSVKNYSITYGPGGALLTREAPPVVINRLINGLEYNFTVKTRDVNNNISSGVSILATPIGVTTGEGTPFVGDVKFSTQEEVDAWSENFTYVIGNVTIEGADIENLTPLQNLDSIVGKLKIQFTGLQNLSGLENIKKITNSLVFWGNDVLVNNEALNNLTELGSDLTIMENALMPNLDGFASLESIATDIYIGLKGWKNPAGSGPNPELIDFCGLTNLISKNGIGGSVYINHNAYNPSVSDISSGNCVGNASLPENVSNFAGVVEDSKVNLSWELPNDTSITSFELTYSPDGITPISLTNDVTSYTVTGLTNDTEYTFTLTSINASGTSSGAVIVITPGSPIYDGNVKLSTQADVDAFSPNITTITGKLQIYGDDITNLSALSNIKTVQGKLEFISTTSLQTLNGLNIETVGSNLYLSDNTALNDITALTTLTSIGKDLVILGNSVLTSLDGLENVTSIARHVYIGVESWQSPPAEHGNALLSDFCALKTVFEAGGQENDYLVDYNASNPTIQEIKDNCN